MTDKIEWKGSFYYSKLISKIYTLTLFMEFSRVRMENVFPLAEEVKEELSKFEKIARKPTKNEKTTPYRKDLKNGRTQITMKKSHKEALDFIIKDFNQKNYLEFINKYSIQLIFTEFDNYLTSLSSHILKKNSKLLGDIKISVDKLEDMTKEEILEEKISKTINNKFYEGYKELIKGFVKKKLSIKHNIRNDTIEELLELKLIRDIYIHGDGEINQIYLKKTKRKNVKLGEKILLTIEIVKKVIYVTQDIITQLDSVLIKSYPETIDPKFNMISFLKSRDELAIFFSRRETEEGVRNL